MVKCVTKQDQNNREDYSIEEEKNKTKGDKIMRKVTAACFTMLQWIAAHYKNYNASYNRL